MLTSCNQYNFRHWGLATAKHSKYTSSPSLMLSDSVDPRRNVTIGGSEMKHLLFLLAQNYFHNIPWGFWWITQLVGIICNNNLWRRRVRPKKRAYKKQSKTKSIKRQKKKSFPFSSFRFQWNLCLFKCISQFLTVTTNIVSR